MKKIILLLTVITFAISFTGCGGSDEGSTNSDSTVVATVPQESFETECTSQNNFTFTVVGHHKSAGHAEYDSTFAVVRSSFSKLDDSTASFSFSNFEEGAEVKPTNYTITATIYSRGEPLHSGEYSRDGSYGVSYCAVSMVAPTGNIYFNWKMGNPDVGAITLNYFSENQACGSFNLEVNDMSDENYGHVALKGDFVIE